MTDVRVLGKLEVCAVMVLSCGLSPAHPHVTDSLPRFALLPSGVPRQPSVFSSHRRPELGHSPHEPSIRLERRRQRQHWARHWGSGEHETEAKGGVGLWPGLGTGGAGEVQGQALNAQGDRGEL